MTISVTYRSIDRVRISRKFKTVEGARRFATKYVGNHPEIGCGYAVSGDGIGKITAQGVTLAALFASEPAPASDHDDADYAHEIAVRDWRAQQDAKRDQLAADDEFRPYRTKGCTCCDHQLVQVGCDCPAENSLAYDDGFPF